MKKLSKEKRQQLVLVALLTVGAAAGLWFGLINYQKHTLEALVARKTQAQGEFQKVKQSIENAEKVDAQLAETAKQLARFEDGMASGDLYSWAITTLRQFKAPYNKVEIPQFSAIDGPKDVPLIPRFPYKQAALTVGGTAYFYDFGRFVADLENQYPYLRVLNLSLEPASGARDDKEKLNFRMDIAALVKPSRLD